MRPAPGPALLLVAATVLACACTAPPVEDGFLSGAAGARLFYRVMGQGPDTVVVVHGGPGAGMHSILPSVEPLARDFVLVLYDQRGGGRSTLPADTSQLGAEYFVEDLEAVRRHFGLERMKVIAHSFGPILVARYAERYPDRLDRMVFHGAVGPEHGQAVRIIQTPRGPAPDSALAARSAGLLESLLQGTAADPVAACREYEATGRELAEARGEAVSYAGTTCRMPPEAVRYYYLHTAQLAPRTFGRWDFTQSLRRVDAPLLVVYGRQDSVALPAQRAWAAALPDARLLLVPGAGKAALSDRPDLVIPAVMTFLRGDWPAAAGPTTATARRHDQRALAVRPSGPSRSECAFLTRQAVSPSRPVLSPEHINEASGPGPVR